MHMMGNHCDRGLARLPMPGYSADWPSSSKTPTSTSRSTTRYGTTATISICWTVCVFTRVWKLPRNSGLPILKLEVPWGPEVSGLIDSGGLTDTHRKEL